MSVLASVVVPAYDAEKTLEDCLCALRGQDLAPELFEIIVVDDGSRDGTARVATSFGVQVIRRRNGGAGAARNAGLKHANGDWVAFTDADCIPARSWLRRLIGAASAGGPDRPAIGAAGKTVGFESTTPAAKFCDLAGSLDAGRSLTHPKFPFAPSANLMYRRSVLERVGGFDERYSSYEACDLHWRITHAESGPFIYEPRALVLHRHRENWSAYWRQQYSYGVGYGQFMLGHRDACSWTLSNELREWGAIARLGLVAWLPPHNDARLHRRGQFVKRLAQHLGFMSTRWDRRERARW